MPQIDSATLQRKLWAEAEQESLEAVKAAGVEVHYPEKDAFAKSVEEMYEEYESDDMIMDLITRIRKLEDISTPKIAEKPETETSQMEGAE